MVLGGQYISTLLAQEQECSCLLWHCQTWQNNGWEIIQTDRIKWAMWVELAPMIYKCNIQYTCSLVHECFQPMVTTSFPISFERNTCAGKRFGQSSRRAGSEERKEAGCPTSKLLCGNRHHYCKFQAKSWLIKCPFKLIHSLSQMDNSSWWHPRRNKEMRGLLAYVLTANVSLQIAQISCYTKLRGNFSLKETNCQSLTA